MQEYYWLDVNGNPIGESRNANEHWLHGESSYFTTYAYYGEEQRTDERYMDIFYESSPERWV